MSHFSENVLLLYQKMTSLYIELEKNKKHEQVLLIPTFSDILSLALHDVEYYE